MSAVFAKRRARAVELMGATPHAEELLAFYVGLLEAQQRVANGVAVDRWLTARPHLRIDRLPTEELLEPFARFLEDLATIGTEVIAAGCAELLGAEDVVRATVLRAVLLGRDASSPEAEFHARAFLEPVLTELVSAAPASSSSGDHGGSCPACGARPIVAVTRDLPDALGSRSLVCSLCATEWRYPRLTCVTCGESDASKLLVHTPDSVDHVRLEECVSCSRYIKSVDVRANGRAVPVVDELATVELDLWARDRGLTKRCANVLGL